MKLLFISLVLVSGVAVSCERHDFEGPNGTKQLNQHHAAGAEHAPSAEHAEQPSH